MNRHSHMEDLAHPGRMISILLEELCPGVAIPYIFTATGIPICGCSVRIVSKHKGGSGRATDWKLGVRPVELYTLRCQTINVRSRTQRITICGDSSGGQIIRDDEQNVGFLEIPI